MTGLEAKTVTGYSETLFNEIWLERFDVSGRGEVERLCGFQVSRGEDLRSIADEGRFKFVSDEAFGCPTERAIIIGERGR